jgi:hypothetical protein
MAIHLVTGLEPACNHESPIEHLRQNNVVFTGYLESIETSKPDNLGKHWIFLNFRVCDVWKGPNDKRIRVTISSIDEFDWAPFQAGEYYLVLARNVGGRAYLHQCSQTKPFRFALFERYLYSRPIYSSIYSNWATFGASELAMSAMSQSIPEKAFQYMDFKSAKQDSAVLDSILVGIASGSLEGDSDRALKALSVVRGLYDWVRRSEYTSREAALPTTQVITNEEFFGTVDEYGNQPSIFNYRLSGELGPSPSSEAVIQLLMIRLLVENLKPPEGSTMCLTIQMDGRASDPSSQFLSALKDVNLRLVPRSECHRKHGYRQSPSHRQIACVIENIRWLAVHRAHISGRIGDQSMSTTAVWRNGEWYLLNAVTVGTRCGWFH